VSITRQRARARALGMVGSLNQEGGYPVAARDCALGWHWGWQMGENDGSEAAVHRFA
jgi:hypothetical protein